MVPFFMRATSRRGDHDVREDSIGEGLRVADVVVARAGQSLLEVIVAGPEQSLLIRRAVGQCLARIAEGVVGVCRAGEHAEGNVVDRNNRPRFTRHPSERPQEADDRRVEVRRILVGKAVRRIGDRHHFRTCDCA